jgi:hypothetical protein
LPLESFPAIGNNTSSVSTVTQNQPFLNQAIKPSILLLTSALFFRDFCVSGAVGQLCQPGRRVSNNCVAAEIPRFCGGYLLWPREEKNFHIFS